jgi:hypothetical protein
MCRGHGVQYGRQLRSQFRHQPRQQFGQHHGGRDTYQALDGVGLA